MNEKNKVVNAGLGYTVGNYLLKGLTFFTVPIFTRLLSTGEYGLYNTFIAYEGILFVLIGLAFNSSYRKAWYRYEKKENDLYYDEYVSTTMVIISISIIFWMCLIILLRNHTEDLLGLDFPSTFLLVLYSAATAILACYNADVGIKYEYKRFIKISGTNAIANIVLSILLILTIFNNKRYLGRMIGTTMPAVVLAVFIVKNYFKTSMPRLKKDYISWGLRYSVPIIPYGIGLVLLGTFDKIMILRMVGEEAAGVYSFAYNIFALVNVTSISLDNVWSPWATGKMNSKSYSVIRDRSTKYIFLMTLFSSIVMLIGTELVKLLGEESYWEASGSVIPIVAGGFFSFLCTIPISIEYFYEKTQYIAAGTTFAGVINIILNYIFIKKYGYIAAAYTTLFTYFLYFIMHYLIVHCIHGKGLLNTRAFASCSCIILCITVYSLMFMDNWVFRWIVAIVFGLILVWFEEKNFHIGKNLLKRLVIRNEH